MQKATFGAGCFWGVEKTFRAVPGVLDAAVGYTGGAFPNPTYQDVCGGNTGHAEAVQVEFDPAIISYGKLLDVFWRSHNPSRPRHDDDSGSQYRSAIFFHDGAQEAAARESKETLQNSGRYDTPIATEIVPATMFYRAEEYHQRYAEKHGRG